MNILIVSLRGPTNADRRGGAQDYIQFIAAPWVKLGHNVTIACSQERINDMCLPAHETVDGITVTRVGSPTNRVIPLIRAAREASRSHDIVVENIMGFPLLLPQLMPSGTLLIAIKHHFEGRAFISGQGLLKGSLGIFFESVLQPLCYRKTPFVGVSRKTAAEITGMWVHLNAPLAIIPPGIDLNPDELPPNRSDYPLVLYFGAVDTGRKKIDHLIEAFREVLLHVPDAQLVIGGDGPDRPRMEHMARNMPIHFTGFLSESDKDKLLRSAWIFASPSMTEGFGITWVEANAYGLPVVGYDLGLDTVDAQCAIMVEKRDIDSLAAAVVRLLTEPETRSQMSDAARLNAKRFNWSESSRRFMQFIERLVRNSH